MIQDSPYFDRQVFYPEMLLLANQLDIVGLYKINIKGRDFGSIGGIYKGAVAFYEHQKNLGRPITLREFPSQLVKISQSIKR